MYPDGYSYAGTIVTDGNTVEYAPGSDNPVDIMNDMARFLGGIYRQEGSNVDAIEFAGDTYTWDASEPLKGSNWSKSGDASVQADTLVTALVAAFNGGQTTFVLKMNGKDVTFSIVS